MLILLLISNIKLTNFIVFFLYFFLLKTDFISIFWRCFLKIIGFIKSIRKLFLKNFIIWTALLSWLWKLFFISFSNTIIINEILLWYLLNFNLIIINWSNVLYTRCFILQLNYIYLIVNFSILLWVILLFFFLIFKKIFLLAFKINRII